MESFILFFAVLSGLAVGYLAKEMYETRLKEIKKQKMKKKENERRKKEADEITRKMFSDAIQMGMRWVFENVDSDYPKTTENNKSSN